MKILLKINLLVFSSLILISLFSCKDSSNPTKNTDANKKDTVKVVPLKQSIIIIDSLSGNIFSNEDAVIFYGKYENVDFNSISAKLGDNKLQIVDSTAKYLKFKFLSQKQNDGVNLKLYLFSKDSLVYSNSTITYFNKFIVDSATSYIFKSGSDISIYGKNFGTNKEFLKLYLNDKIFDKFEVLDNKITIHPPSDLNEFKVKIIKFTQVYNIGNSFKVAPLVIDDLSQYKFIDLKINGIIYTLNNPIVNDTSSYNFNYSGLPITKFDPKTNLVQSQSINKLRNLDLTTVINFYINNKDINLADSILIIFQSNKCSPIRNMCERKAIINNKDDLIQCGTCHLPELNYLYDFNYSITLKNIVFQEINHNQFKILINSIEIINSIKQLVLYDNEEYLYCVFAPFEEDVRHSYNNISLTSFKSNDNSIIEITLRK